MAAKELLCVCALIVSYKHVSISAPEPPLFSFVAWASGAALHAWFIKCTLAEVCLVRWYAGLTGRLLAIETVYSSGT